MICQKLVARIVNGVLSRLQVEGFVYLDDILLVAKKPKFRQGTRCVARKLVKASFISPKSVCEPTQQLDFIGKWFDTEKGCMGNKQGLLVGILGLWVLAVVGPFEALLMSRLLGRLERALRPNAGAAAFLASAYRWMQGDFTHFGIPLMRSLMTAFIFANIPQRLKPDVCPVLHVGVEDKHVLFCDAAPSADGHQFFMGVYPLGRGFKHWKCPRWIQTLQQAELLAIVLSFQLAAFMGWERAYLGSDSFVAQAQATSLRANTALQTQHRILRRFFWFRSWARIVMTVFWVSTELNPANPASRALIFVTVTRSVGVQTRGLELGSLCRSLFMPAPQCHLFLGVLRNEVTSICLVSHSLDHTGRAGEALWFD